MKQILTSLTFALMLSQLIFGQVHSIFDVNEIKIYATNGHYLWRPTGVNSHLLTFPKGSNTSTLYYANFICSAIDSSSGIIKKFPYNDSNLESEFYPGPLSMDGQFNQAPTGSIDYNHIWNITATEIDDFIAAYYAGGSTFANYPIPQDFLTWPAHGPNGFDQNLSPFHDMNGDGIYNPYDGDFPKIKGTQYLRWIFNSQTNNVNDSMGIEFRVSLFGCSSHDQTSALNRTFFMEYEILNRSNNTYKEFYLGIHLDADIGCANDDLSRTNVSANAIQTYSTKNNSDNCNPQNAYYNNPPVQGVALINLNSLTSEPLITSTQIVTNSINSTTSAYYAYELHNLMKGKNKFGTPFYFGGGGEDSVSNIPIVYMFPGNSDPNLFGTNGVPYPYVWTMENPYNSGGSGMEFDHQQRISSLPLTLRPNEKITATFAFVITQDINLSNEQLLDINAQQIKTLKSQYANNQLPCQSSILNIQEIKQNNTIFYPNPTDGMVYIMGNEIYESINIYSISGKKVMSFQNSNFIDMKNLQTGLYIIELQKDNKIVRNKIIKK